MYRLLLILTFFFFTAFGYRQSAVASLVNPEFPTPDQQRTGSSLVDVLTTLEEKYQTTFSYDQELLQHKTVKGSLPHQQERNLAETLVHLLSPLHLTYEKFDEYTYVIYPKKPSALSETPELTIRAARPTLTRLPTSQLSLLGNDALATALQNISGTVTDVATNEPLPGVNVLAKGTRVGTVTDIDGNYQLSAPDEATALVFSSVGYTSQEVEINGRTTVDASLRADVTELGEVVVTALGIKKETKKLGYATATVEPEELTVNRTTNFMNSLQGKVPGVNISPAATGAAGTSKIRIRGQSSFNGQNSPLIVVNGVPIDNTNFGVSSGGQGLNNSDTGDGLASINPDIIESMTVLKGATAAALYGSRAKDGVIMITTKTRGADQGIGISWNSNFTLDIPIDDLDYQYEYGQGERGMRPTSANPTSGTWSFGERFEPGMTQVLFDGVEVPYVPQRNRIREFFNTGTTFTNTISLSSGGERGGLNLALSQLDNAGILPTSGFERYTANLGFTQNLVEGLNISGNINYSREKHTNPPQTATQSLSPLTGLYTMSNSMPLELMERYRYDEDGDEFEWTRFRPRGNPYFITSDHFNQVKRDRIFGNVSVRYDPTEWLYVQGRIGQDYYGRQQEFNLPTGIAFLSPAPTGFSNGRFTQEERFFREINADFLIGASRQFEKFGVDLTLGGNRMYRRSDLHSILVEDFLVRDLYTVANSRVKNPIYRYSERQVNSLYGAADFSYNDYLFINVTARNDWFSTLAPANRSILYPSVTGSFVFSQAIAAMPNWLTFGKLRAAYAEVGSDTDVNPFSQSLFYNVDNNLFVSTGGTEVPVGFIGDRSVPNADLKPMRVSEYEFGVNLRMFDRINLDVAYYNKLTADQILEAQISNTSGYTRRLINVGESVNRGVELLVGLTPVRTENLTWNLTFNGSYNTSEVLQLGTIVSDTVITVGGGAFNRGDAVRQVVGQPLGQLFTHGYQRDGQGRKIFDPNTGFPVPTAAPIAFGSAIPRWVGGITNDLRYRDLRVSFLVDFKLGHKLMSGTNFNAWRHGHHQGTLKGREEGFIVGDGVNPNGEINTTEAPIQPFYETVGPQGRREDFVYNAGFWKLRQATISYDFTRLLPEGSFIQSLSLSAVGRNLLVFKKWTENIDPEQGVYTSDTQVGMEANGLPIARSIGFNLNVKF